MTADIKSIIEDVVRERLTDARITDVRIEEDEDSDGDTVYRIMVIFDNETGRLNADRTSGLARHLRSRLSESNVYNFPIFRFVSQADAKKLRAAAA
jgi:hypothetical protein